MHRALLEYIASAKIKNNDSIECGVCGNFHERRHADMYSTTLEKFVHVRKKITGSEMMSSNHQNQTCLVISVSSRRKPLGNFDHGINR